MPVIRINETMFELLKAKAKKEDRPLSRVLTEIISLHFKAKKKKGTHPEFQRLKDIFMAVWEKNNNFQYRWSVIDATALNRLIVNLESINKSDKPVSELFGALMQHLPDFYKDKNINAINKNINGIIADIKRGANKATANQQAGKYNFS
jgi:hypothetical protein